MENILKILITFVFLSLLVDAAVSIPPADRHKYHSRGENASASAMVSMKFTLSAGAVARFLKNNHFKLSDRAKKALAKVDLTRGAKKTHYYYGNRLEDLRRKWKPSLSRRGVSAFDDCLLATADTVDQIISSVEILSGASSEMAVSALQKAQIYNLFSAALTNVDTCIDGFSHSRADKKVQADILVDDWMGLNSSVSDLFSRMDRLKVKEAETVIVPGDGEGWPEWLSDEDRMLLKQPMMVHETVALDGSGNYMTVSEAVKNAPVKSSQRYVIRIKKGKYMENVVIPKNMTNLVFIGDGHEKTFIIASKNVVDGDTTFSSATVGVAGDGFLARGITFINRAGKSKNQAVALRVNADRSVFYGCVMIGYQNTLYVHSLRQFYKQCIISGAVDFIFGNAAAFFLDCDIQVTAPNSGQKNTITAHGRNHPNQNTGIVIHKSRISATPEGEGKFTTYLGRPWKAYSRTVVMQTNISNVIHPNGWLKSRGEFALDTLEYAEYMNIGNGAGTASRVKWKGFRVLTKEEEVEPFTLGNFLGGKS